jgi:hypothetical protein
MTDLLNQTSDSGALVPPLYTPAMPAAPLAAANAHLPPAGSGSKDAGLSIPLSRSGQSPASIVKQTHSRTSVNIRFIPILWVCPITEVASLFQSDQETTWTFDGNPRLEDLP